MAALFDDPTTEGDAEATPIINSHFVTNYRVPAMKYNSGRSKNKQFERKVN
jgi:hypothetical protein